MLLRHQSDQVERQIAAYESGKAPKIVSVPLGTSTFELEIDQFVAHPEIMNSGVQVVSFLAERANLIRGKVVTDMGTGSGIIGIAAGHLGARQVYMPEIEERAVLNATRNVQSNLLSHTCDVFQSDLFSEYGDRELSDVQIFNHPFFLDSPLEQKQWTRMMLGQIGLIDDFFVQAPKFSTKEAIYILPWLTIASNEDGPDNDPEKRAPSLGYKIIDVLEQAPAPMGLQQALFKIYTLQR